MSDLRCPAARLGYRILDGWRGLEDSARAAHAPSLYAPNSGEASKPSSAFRLSHPPRLARKGADSRRSGVGGTTRARVLAPGQAGPCPRRWHSCAPVRAWWVLGVRLRVTKDREPSSFGRFSLPWPHLDAYYALLGQLRPSSATAWHRINRSFHSRPVSPFRFPVTCGYCSADEPCLRSQCLILRDTTTSGYHVPRSRLKTSPS